MLNFLRCDSGVLLKVLAPVLGPGSASDLWHWSPFLHRRDLHIRVFVD
jgi:hypothetical protein